MNTKQLSARPLYMQLHDALTERVTTGQWRPGTTLPNEGDLAREFGVSAGTMRKALDLMEAERLVTRRQGRGTFVNDQATEESAARFCNIRALDGRRVAAQFREVWMAQGQADETERQRLGLREDNNRVHRIRRLRTDGDRPLMVEDVCLPAGLFPNRPDGKAGMTHIVVLAQQHGIMLGRAEERVSIGLAAPEVANLLEVAPNSALMVLDRVTHALDGRQVEWRTGYCHLGNEYTYLAEIK